MVERLPLDDIADILVGTIAGHTVDGGDGPASYGTDEIRNPWSSPTRHLPSDVDLSRTVRVAAGDVAITATGAPVHTALVREPQEGAVLARECIVMRLHAGTDLVRTGWLYAWTWTDDFRFQIERLAAGTTVPRLTAWGLRTVTIPVIAHAQQTRIGALTAQLESARQLANETASNLARLQQTAVDLALYELLP